MKVVVTNRKARHNYTIIETYEAGIALEGNEVKSLRTRGSSIEESFCRVEACEVLVYNMYISEFEKSSYFKTESRRVRKLLLHKNEIRKMLVATTQQGFTLIPLKVYFNERGIVKIEIAIAKGRRIYDKRKKLKDEIIRKETQRALKRYYRKS